MSRMKPLAVFKHVTNITSALLITVSSMGTALLIPQVALAEQATLHVTPTSPNGWYARPSDLATGGTVKYVVSAGAPLGTGALELATSSSPNAITHLTHAADIALNAVSALSYETKQLVAADATNGNATLRVSINFGGGTTEDDQLMFEPYYNGFNGTAQSGWKPWDLKSGKFWSNFGLKYGSLGGNFGSGGYDTNFTIADVLAAHHDARIVGLILSMGDGNPSQQILIDNVKLNDTTYDFEAFTPPSPREQTTSTVLPSDLAINTTNWYYFDDNTNIPSATNTPGLHEITSNPTPVAGDTGAIKLNGSNGARNTIATNHYAMTNLRDIAKIGFSTYQPNTNAGGSSNSPFMNFNVDLGTGLTTYQGRLVYVPETNASPLPAQNSWQDYEAVASNGQWNWSFFVRNGNKWPDGSTAQNRSWNDIISSFPNAKITTQLLVRSGEPYDNNFTAYIDHIYVATATSNINYNFEQVVPDTTLPVLSITSPTVNQVINGRSVAISGTATDTNFNYYYCYVSNVNGHEYGARDASCTTTWHDVTSPGLLGTITLPNDLSDGNYVAHLIGKDKAGNTSEATQPFVLDNTAPVAAITAPTSDLFKGIVTISGTVNDVNPDHYYFVVKDSNGTVIAGPGVVNQAAVSDWAWNTTTVEDGNYTITLEARDKAGNKDNSSVASMSVTVDNTLPTVSITSPSNGQVLSVNATGRMLSISGTATDANFNYYYCYVTNASSEVGIRDAKCETAWYLGSLFHLAFAHTATGTSNGSLGKIDMTGLADGAYTVHLVAHDLAGNVSETSMPFVLDNTAPTVTHNRIVSMLTGDKFTLAAVVTGDTNVTYLWSVSDKKLLNDPKDTLDGSTLVIGPAGPKKDYTATLTVTDGAGNVATVYYDVTINTPSVLGASTGNNTPAAKQAAVTQTAPVVLDDSVVALNTVPTVEPTAEAVNNNGKVKGDNATQAKADNTEVAATTGFLGLGWWWLPVLLVFFGILWFFGASVRHKRSRY